MSNTINNSQSTIHNSQFENPNLRWTAVFVDTLAHSGLRAACISPGSRSTPLTLAFHAHPHIRVARRLDERGAAFFALGMALAWDAPVALVCTSGTAVANYFPAVIEAKMSHVPLLLLTADRPPELRHSGANQTIDQVKIFGDQVLWSVDVALPEEDPSDVSLRNLHTLAARAYATANGLVKGPVHLNFPFRKPLQPKNREPLAVSRESPTDYGTRITGHGLRDTDYGVQIDRGRIHPTNDQLRLLADAINRHDRGLIVCGPRCPGGAFPQAVAALARECGYPLLADPVSGVRFWRFQRKGAKEKKEDKVVVSGYETFCMGEGPAWEEPEVVVRFGAAPTSKWLNVYLDRIEPAYRFHVRADGVWADDSHRVTHFLQADEALTCRQLAARIEPRPFSPWQAQVMATETAVWQAMASALDGLPFFDGTAVYDLVTMLPANTRLLMGNSLPIRHLDQFGRARSVPIHAHANRGASGIDGNISTGLGLAAASGERTVIVVGDVTFYHDLNGLLPVDLPRSRREQGEEKSGENSASSASLRLKNVTIVLLNNDGGGIFRRLPIRDVEPPFTDLFLTPHGLDFEPAARMFGWEFVRVETRADFRTAFAASLDEPTPCVIEVRTDSALDAERREQLIRIVN